MFGTLMGFDGSLDEFRRLQEEIDNLFDQWPATTGVRSVPRGTFPPINVGATPTRACRTARVSNRATFLGR